MTDRTKPSNTPFEGYDPSQRAEILETEGRNVRGTGEQSDLITELTPDRGEPITGTADPEERLHERDGTIDGPLQNDAALGARDAHSADPATAKREAREDASHAPQRPVEEQGRAMLRGDARDAADRNADAERTTRHGAATRTTAPGAGARAPDAKRPELATKVAAKLGDVA